MRLLIAIPTLDYMHYAFVESLIKLTNYLKDDGVDFTVELRSGTLVYHARENICKKAMGEGYTHVLWIDADMIFEETVVDDLLFCGKPYVAGIFHARRPPHSSCLFKSITPIERYSMDTYPSEPFEIAASGMGLVLMETSVIQTVFDNFSTCFMPTMALGEDIAFCERVGKCGIKMYADPSVRVGHIGHITIMPESEEEWKGKVANIERIKKC